ncbi:HWE histidine kinase domain-containing protein [Brevundimonas diminuta]|uniref:HWE histidine kinase domain-containing protein n=1 Tax=Brevundimonas diminuta TaxID=293 RepID=UPI003D07A67E
MQRVAQKIDLVAAFDSSPNPYALIDRDLRFIGMNQAYLGVIQREREELVGHSLLDFFAPGDDENSRAANARMKASIDKVIKTGEPDHLAVLHHPMMRAQADGGRALIDRYWSCTHTPIKDERGQVTHILQDSTDITDVLEFRSDRDTPDTSSRPVDARTALDAIARSGIFQRAMKIEANHQRLEAEHRQITDMLMNAPGFVAVLNGPDHIIQFCNEACYRLVSHREILGLSVRDALPELGSQGHLDFLNDVYETGEPVYGRQRAFTLRHTQDGPLDNRYIDFAYQPIRDEDLRIIGIFVQGHDVTEVVLAAERQKLMIDELNHRVKNTLATVQSIAMQTARTHADPGSFAQAFQSRILALSHTHDLLTRSHWEGADLRAVLEHETKAHGSGRLSLQGPHVALSPARAVSLGMIFHELATNAAKYGALSCADGYVEVRWRLADHNSPRLEICWRETGSAPIPEPVRRGFGTRLIERNVRHDLHGDVSLSYRPEGFCAEISLPMETETL